MARALIRANAHLPGHPRGTEREVELTDREVKRAASGQTSIVRTWDLDGDETPLAGRVRTGTISDLLALVDTGEVSAVEALEAEQAGRNRVGAVNELRQRVQDEQEQAEAAADHSPEGDAPDEGSEAAEGI